MKKAKLLPALAGTMGLLCLVGAESGCGIEATDGSEQLYQGEERVAASEQASTTCITIQRGVLGDFIDTGIRSDYPYSTAGTAAFVGVSTTPTRDQWAMFQADLSPIPVGAVVTSATLHLTQGGYNAAGMVMDIHRATSSWTEGYSWNIFGVSYDPAPEVSYINSSISGTGTFSFDATALVQAWRGGTANYGLVIRQSGGPLGTTRYNTSDNPNAALRPSLDVCYDDTSCSDGLQNQGETGVDCGGPCGNCGCVGAACTTGAWGVVGSTSGSNNATSATTDAAGNVYMVGKLFSSMTFPGAPTLVSAGSGDLFVVKTNSAGTVQWAKRFGGTGDENSGDVAVDTAGNVYFSAYSSGSVDLGGGSLPAAGGYDFLLAKLDANGNHVWSKRIGDAATQQIAGGLGIDPSGTLVWSGSFQGTVDFGSGPLTSAGSEDIFYVRYDAAGNLLSAQTFGDAGYNSARDLGIDAAGNVAIYGLSTSVDFGLGPTPAGSTVFLARFDASGTIQGSYGYTGSLFPTRLAVSKSGLMAITGTYGQSGTPDFGGAPLPPPPLLINDSNVYVAVFNPDGSHRFSSGHGYDQNESGMSLSFDSADNLVFSGTINSVTDYGGGPITPNGTSFALVKFDSFGHNIWSYSPGYGSTYSQYVHVDSADDIIVYGSAGSLNIGGLIVSGSGVMLAKLDE